MISCCSAVATRDRMCCIDSLARGRTPICFVAIIAFRMSASHRTEISLPWSYRSSDREDLSVWLRSDIARMCVGPCFVAASERVSFVRCEDCAVWSKNKNNISGVAMAAGNAHCVRSWVPKGRHPVGAAEGCGPQVRELGLRGAGNHVVRPLLAQPGGRRKASPLGSRPLPLHPFAERSEPRGFPKQPSVRCKSKGQNPELWPAGPALLLALWRPAGP